ncbi:MAG: polysaccharide biosynthesis/export family protein [Pseudomonadota bacterium]
MRRVVFAAVLLCWVFFACGCSWLPGLEPKAQMAGDVPQPSEDTYRMGCSDVIELQVWKEPDLTHQVVIRTDGKISLPLLGEVVAAGKTTGQLEAELVEGYSQFLANPVVTVVVREPNSSKFFVVGEVMRPGEYSLPRGITVLQGISTAGGFTEWANRRKLLVVRRLGDQEQHLRVDYKRVVFGDRPQDNCPLLPGDTIVVP